MMFFSDGNDAEQLARLASAARLKEIFSAVEKAVYDLSANANEALVLSLLSLI